MWGKGGASDFVLCFGVLSCIVELCFACGELLCFGIFIFVLGGALCIVGLKGWFIRRVEKWGESAGRSIECEVWG